MQYDESFVFDPEMDDMFSIFSEDTGDAELMRAQQTFNRLSAEEQVMVAKKATFEKAPKVMKNDIRRYFATMFMNTLNSGDFCKLQDYYQTFMKSQTRFIADHKEIDDRYNIPNTLETCGPRLMAHYLLGTFIMYPDMVLIMNGTRLTTSNAWKGTKVDIDMDVLATKMYDLSVDEWLPQLSTLEEKYQLVMEEKRKAVLAKKHKQCVEIDALTTLHVAKLDKSPDYAVTEAVSDASSPCGSEYDFEPHHLTDSDVNVGQKRKPGRSLSAGDASGVAQVFQPPVHIPEEYVHSLVAKAKLLPEPAQLRMKGTISMFLDENNHIQHMNMTMRPAT